MTPLNALLIILWSTSTIGEAISLRGSTKRSLTNLPRATIGTKPLSHCQGDCSSDSDCRDGLVCDNTRKHGIPSPVPGCYISPTEDSGTDFCVYPSDLNNEGDNADDPILDINADEETNDDTSIYNNGPKVSVGSSKPLEHCQGDCSSDSDCHGDLVCDTSRKYGIPSPVPGCSIASTEDSGTDFCVYPQDLKNQGGDDDADDVDGADDADEAEEAENTEDPIEDVTADESIYYDNSGYNNGPKVSVGSSKPLGHCQGDCSSDSDCEGDLVCDTSRKFGIPSPVPGCSIASTEDSGTDFCVHPGDLISTDRTFVFSETSLTFIAENPDTSEAYNKLGLCEGDCESDYDCGQGLMCWQRGGSEEVPGCKPGGSGDISGKDYCVDEIYRGDDGNQFYFPADEAFRLKLYWEEGYMWQEESFERRWCIESMNKPSAVGDGIFISECSIKSNDLLEFVPVDDMYFQIKETAGDNCYQRFGDAMSWQTCHLAAVDQHFWAADMEDNVLDTKTVEKFELRPRRSYEIDEVSCVTQKHYPKDAERLVLDDCDKVRRHSDTSLWQKY